MSEESPEQRSPWQTFVAWHYDEKLYRDVYTMFVSALLVVLVANLPLPSPAWCRGVRSWRWFQVFCSA